MIKEGNYFSWVQFSNEISLMENKNITDGIIQKISLEPRLRDKCN